MMRQRGFTVVEILVALFVASLLSVFVLSLTRSQLVTYEMQSQTNSVQENTRESFDFVETLLRRACGGISQGRVRILTGSSINFETYCVQVYDGAAVGTAAAPGVGSTGSFTSSSPASAADAIEIIYGDGANISSVGNQTATDWSAGHIQVADMTSFTGTDNQLILVSDMKTGYVFKQTAHATSGSSAPFTGYITVSGISADPSNANEFAIGAGSYIMPAKVYSLYIDTATDTRNPMLRLDPDGVAGTDHSDAEPLAEGVEDLQIAIGWDANNDGVITDSSNSSDEWYGNAGTTEISSGSPFPGTLLWTTDGTAAGPRQIRATLIMRSLNQYAGTPAKVAPAENRGTSSGWNWNAVSSGTATVGPRFRQLRVIVAPRAWNTSE
jgi:prepilin-type N-terminal cleavage/methylation domain-containing protein